MVLLLRERIGVGPGLHVTRTNNIQVGGIESLHVMQEQWLLAYTFLASVWIVPGVYGYEGERNVGCYSDGW